jgi:uncharacterized protein with HEPN domain
MSERETHLLLKDMIAALEYILEFTEGYTFENYEADVKTKYAVERNFEIIGEAASRIPESFKVIHSHIEWRIIKDFRNFIIHEYFGINNEIVWETIKQQLPELLIDLHTLEVKFNNKS